MAIPAADLQARVGADLADLEKGLKAGSSQIHGFAATGTKELQGLGSAITALSPQAGMMSQAMRYGLAGGALYMGVQVAGATVDLMRMGAAAERLGGQFETVWGSGGALSKLRAATRGAIDDSTLMLNANRAALMGVAKSVDDLAILWDIAIQRGATVGRTALESVEAVTIGVGRNSPLILDNIAIVGLGENSYKRYAAQLNRTVESLTDLEKKQAIVNDIMAMATGAGAESEAGKVALSFERIDAALKNIKERGAIKLVDIFGQEIVNLSTILSEQTEEDLAKATNSYEEFFAAVKKQRKEYDDAFLGGMKGDTDEASFAAFYRRQKAAGDAANEAKGSIGELTRAQVESIQAQQRLNDAIKALPAADVEWMNEDFRQLENEQYRVASALLTWTMSLPGQLIAIVSQLNQMKQHLVDIGGQVRGQLSGMSARGIISTDQAYNWENEYIRQRSTIEKMQGIDALTRSRMLSDLDAQWQQTFANYERGISDMEAATRRASDEIKSNLSTIFQPTQGADFTSQLDQLGFHVDTWDEKARRMADIANRGMESPWAKIMVPPPDVVAQGDNAVKAWAVNWQKQFYAGMMPGEIGWQAVVDRYKELVTNKANWEAIFKQAEQAIRDQGLTFNQDLFNQAVSGATGGAVGPGVGVADAITAGMPSAFKNNPVSSMIKAGFDEDMAGQGKEVLRLIGFSASAIIAGAMGEGFKNANFLKMMATAVAPGVWEWIQSQQSRKPDSGKKD